jgi:anti-anti-sigma regulatory factor
MTNITLPPRCDRAAADAVLAEILAAKASPVVIDGTGVEHVGQATLQLLLSARRSGTVTISAGERLRDVARLTGLEEELFSGTQA